MRLFEAIYILNNAIEASTDKEVKQAWQGLAPHLMPGREGRLPPSDLRVAGHEALELAEQFHKTGLLTEWQTPPKNSQAMEKLIHRQTLLLEQLLDLFEGRRLREMVDAGFPDDELESLMGSGHVFDEIYQPDYCEHCGEALSPEQKHRCEGVIHVS